MRTAEVMTISATPNAAAGTGPSRTIASTSATAEALSCRLRADTLSH